MDISIGYTDYDDFYLDTDTQLFENLELNTQYIFADRVVKDHAVIYGLEVVPTGPIDIWIYVSEIISQEI